MLFCLITKAEKCSISNASLEAEWLCLVTMLKLSMVVFVSPATLKITRTVDFSILLLNSITIILFVYLLHHYCP